MESLVRVRRSAISEKGVHLLILPTMVFVPTFLPPNIVIMHANLCSLISYPLDPIDSQMPDNFDDNPLAWFTQFRNAPTTSSLYVKGMARVDDVATAIKQDIAQGTFPTISWVIAPTAESEHPAARPADGANFVSGVLSAIASDPTTWNSTVVLLNYDENDGFFDHVAPPTAPAGTPDEFVAGLPIGLGPRVPLFVISPWSTGPKVCSQVFDHTSTLQFIEKVTGVKCPHISAYRRQICGDLTACFDFTSAPKPFPTNLPNTQQLVAEANQQEKLPKAVPPPLGGSSVIPLQEPGDRPAANIGYAWNVIGWTDWNGKVSMNVSCLGKLAGSFTLYTVNFDPYSATSFVVPSGAIITRTITPSAASKGLYDVDLHGPDGFLRRLAGDVTLWHKTGPIPEAYIEDLLDGQSLQLNLVNQGQVSVELQIGSNQAYLAPVGQSPSKVTVLAGQSMTILMKATNSGRYDYEVSAPSISVWRRRFAGRLYKYQPS